MPANRALGRGMSIWLVLCAAAAAAAVLPVLANGLAWDDVFLTGPARNHRASGDLASAITESYWAGGSYVSVEPVPYWRPLTSALLWSVGLAAGSAPWAFHLLSLLALSCAAAAIGSLVARLAPPGEARTVAWLAALVWTAHPFASEVIGMATNAGDHLALASLLAGVAFQMDVLSGARPARVALPASAVLGFLACASKESGAIFVLAPFFARGLERAAGRQPRRGTWPWLFVASIAPVALHISLHLAVAGPAFPPLLSDIGRATLLAAFAWGETLLRAVAPVPAGVLVRVEPGSLTTVAVSALGLGALATAAWHATRVRRPTLPLLGALAALFLLLPPLFSLDPSSDLFELPSRYLHMPLAGLVVAATPLFVRARGRSLDAVVAAVAALLAALSFVRVAEWRDDVSLWSAEHERAPGAAYATVNLAAAMVRARAFTEAEKVLDSARDIEASPPLFASTALALRADIARLRDGDFERAAALFSRSLEAAPWNLSSALGLAETLAASGRMDEAIAFLRRVQDSRWFSERQKRVARDKVEALRRMAGDER